MKDTKICHAWDTVNPTPAQKKRMRSALEARLRADETPAKSPKPEYPDIRDVTRPQCGPEKTGEGKQPQKPRPRYQGVQPKKSRGSAFTLIAAMLAVVVTGGLFLGMMRGKMEESPSQARPIENLPPPTTAVTETTKPTQLPEVYQERIDTYITAIQEGWNPEQCNKANISILTPYVVNLDDLGYALMDLDGDGEEELLITDGSEIYSLYDLGPLGEAVQWITGMDRIHYYLCTDNLIAEIGSSGAAVTTYTFYCFMGTTLDKIQVVDFNADKDRENPWFLGDAMEPITEEKANEIIDTYSHRYISHTTLSGEAPLPEGTVPEKALLNQYAQQLPTLVSGDMSEQCQLYCFYDYDNDGEAELLLGSGKSVYMVLEADPGKADSTPFFAGGSGAAYPCEDHVMEYTGYGQGYTHFSYRKYGGENDGGALDYVYRDEENWYTMDENGDSISISDAEAEAIRGKYKRLNLPWKDISEFPVTISETSGERISALFDDVFMPIAQEGKRLTEGELRSRLEEKGFLGEEGEGLITWTDSEIPEAHLRVPVADASGYVNGPLTYCLPGVVGRYVAVQWEGDTARYWMETGTNRIPYSVSSAQELTDFLTMDGNTLLAMETAESFARAYFAKDRNGMLEQTASDVTIEEGKMFYMDAANLVLQQISGLTDAEEKYEKQGYVQVAVAVYLDEMDSYDFLTMEMVKENDQWKVSSWFLQK